MTAWDLLRVIVRDRILFEESGGGVTFSGGEPLMQPSFLCAMLAGCRSEGIHTVADTCGYATPQVFSHVAELADHFLFDVKLIDPAPHKQYTGVGNELILENLRTAVASGKPLTVRIPVVPGVNDNQANIDATLKILQSTGVRNVDLLAYHETGVEKYRRLDMAAPVKIVPPTEETMKGLYDQFASSGFTVRIGG
jgi:pyruvate formate lyase activating enzyme